MPRCNACNGIVTKTDIDCYVCGEPIPGRSGFSFRRLFAKPDKAAESKRAVLRITMMDSDLHRKPSAS
ncbi:MAG TPA: hypothetical protein VGN17_16080 [Bryobacteraceae bacterium]|jgi:hypothetical protein